MRRPIAGAPRNMADVQRLLNEDDERRRPGVEWPAAWLDYCELRRQVLIEELRHLDRVLVTSGRLRSYTLPQRPK